MLDDAERIAEIHVESWKAAYQGIIPQDYLDSLDQEKRRQVWEEMIPKTEEFLFVGESEGQINGFAHLKLSRDEDADESTGEVTSIYFDPTSWRKGLGSRMMNHLIRHARSIPFQQLTLWVLTNNLSARRFYETVGFFSDEEIKLVERPGFIMEEVRYRLEIGAKCTF